MRSQFWQSHPLAKAEQKSAIEALRLTGLRSRGDVLALLQWLKDPIVSTKRICNHQDHVAPMDFLCDMLLNYVQDFIVWANRSGSKSYLSGLITWVRSGFRPRMETTILGGSFEQSEKAYKAISDFWLATELSDRWLVGVPTKHRTTWKNLSTVSVLTASTRSARGPHPQALIMDEIDEMEQEVYEAALSQPQSKYGIQSSLGKLSTNHRYGGMMDQAISMASEFGAKLYKWCVWECLKSCRDYSCSTCKLSAYCPGIQMKEAEGYYEVHDLVQKLYGMSTNTLQTEWFCEKVGRSDLVYGTQYEEKLHSAYDLPGFNEGVPVYVSIDWGGTNPFSLGAWQQFPGGWVRVDEVYMGDTTNTRLIEEAKKRPWWRNIKDGVGDPGRPDLIKEWGEVGIKIHPANNDVDVGIESVRNALKPVLGAPKLYVSRRCRAWMREISGYKDKNGKPVKEDDHAMDETRYFVMWKLGPVRRGGKVFHLGLKVAEKEGVPEPQPAAAAAPVESEVKDGGNHGQKKQRVFFTH
jgi:hypothetical protein